MANIVVSGTISDPRLIAGVEAALKRYNSTLEPEVAVDGEMAANPAIITDAAAYLQWAWFQQALESYAVQHEREVRFQE